MKTQITCGMEVVYGDIQATIMQRTLTTGKVLIRYSTKSFLWGKKYVEKWVDQGLCQPILLTLQDILIDHIHVPAPKEEAYADKLKGKVKKETKASFTPDHNTLVKALEFMAETSYWNIEKNSYGYRCVARKNHQDSYVRSNELIPRARTNISIEEAITAVYNKINQ